MQNVFTLYEILFSGWGGSGGGGGGNKKSIANLSSAELAQRLMARCVFVQTATCNNTILSSQIT